MRTPRPEQRPQRARAGELKLETQQEDGQFNFYELLTPELLVQIVAELEGRKSSALANPNSDMSQRRYFHAIEALALYASIEQFEEMSFHDEDSKRLIWGIVQPVLKSRDEWSREGDRKEKSILDYCSYLDSIRKLLPEKFAELATEELLERIRTMIQEARSAGNARGLGNALYAGAHIFPTELRNELHQDADWEVLLQGMKDDEQTWSEIFIGVSALYPDRRSQIPKIGDVITDLRQRSERHVELSDAPSYLSSMYSLALVTAPEIHFTNQGIEFGNRDSIHADPLPDRKQV